MADDSRIASASSPETPITELDPMKAAFLTPEEAKSYYTWANFFAAKLGSDRTVKSYFAIQSIVRAEEDCKRCDQLKEWAFDNSIASFASSPYSLTLIQSQRLTLSLLKFRPNNKVPVF